MFTHYALHTNNEVEGGYGFSDSTVLPDQKTVRRVIAVLNTFNLRAYPFLPSKCGQAALAIYRGLQRRGWSLGWDCYLAHPPTDGWDKPTDQGTFDYHAWLRNGDITVELATWAEPVLKWCVVIGRGTGWLQEYPHHVAEKVSPKAFGDFVQTVATWRPQGMGAAAQ